jgi:hypothetical protein
MSSRHRKTWVLAPIAIAIAGAMPGAAQANPLLSGYGGPGQGDQAILGATLLNTPRGGGGSSSSGGGSGEATAASLTAAPTGGGAAVGKLQGKNGRRQPKRGAQASTSTQAVQAPTPSGGSAPVAVASTGSDSGGTLGLSGGDIVYLLLVLAALALTGVLTRQLARRPH